MKIIGIIIVLGIITLGFIFYLNKEQKSVESNNNTKSFEQKLEEVLKSTEIKYSSTNDNFGINFSSEQMVIFQIIRRNLLENSKDDDFGYGIHLSFDDSFPETKGELERFKGSAFANKFKHHIWDGISTYQLDLNTDKKRITELTKEIIEIVYQKELSRIEIEEFEI